MDKLPSSTIDAKVAAVPPEIEHVLAGVQTILHGLVLKELRRSYHAAVKDGDSKPPLHQLMQELETITAGIQDRVDAMKASLLDLVQHEFRRAVVIGLSSVARPPATERGALHPEAPPTPLFGATLPGRSPHVQGGGGQPSPGTAVALPDSLAEKSRNQMYTGRVLLQVKANGNVRSAVRFLAELRRKPQLRLLQVLGNPLQGAGDIEVVMGLRESLDLKELLLQIEGVSLVRSSSESRAPGAASQLTVWLAAVAEEAEPAPPRIRLVS